MYTVLMVLNGLMGILMVWMSLTLVFQLIVSVFGFKKKTEDYKQHDPELRFLVLIPAHNEEGVIAGIIDNMQRMQYPKELYDVYVLADNCEDQTAEISRKLGAKVLEFHKERPDEPTGKSVVLQKAFQALPGYEQNYDAVFFFDADNLVDLNMFSEVNSQFLDSDDRTEVVQCYLGCKNKNGLVALFYYLTYTISNRFLQYSRQRLGLNCGIGGTGFAVRTRYLYQRGGWTVMSLTEDTELQFTATLEGKRVLWNNHVRVYDEKPTKWRASLRQRIRWAQGHWFVAFRNTGRSLKAVFTGKISVWEFVSMEGGALDGLAFLAPMTSTTVVRLTGITAGTAATPCTVDFDKYFLTLTDVPAAETLPMLTAAKRQWNYAALLSNKGEITAEQITALSTMKGLLSLEIRNAAESAFAPECWNGFAGLQQLMVENCEKVSLVPIGALPSLNRLSLVGCRVTGESAIAGVRKLRQLSLTRCNVGDWAFLDGLTWRSTC